jgi:hypothetical protein
MKTTITILIIFMMSSTQSLFAKDITETRSVTIYGYVRGNSYLTWPQVTRSIYVTGVIDGFRAAPALGQSQKNQKTFETCVGVMTVDQLEAIVWKYLQDNPSEWHLYVNMLVLKAILGTSCYKEQVGE